MVVANFACAKNGKHKSQNNLGECLIDASSGRRSLSGDMVCAIGPAALFSF